MNISNPINLILLVYNISLSAMYLIHKIKDCMQYRNKSLYLYYNRIRNLFSLEFTSFSVVVVVVDAFDNKFALQNQLKPT